MGRQQEHFARPDRHIVDAALFRHLEDHVALQLVEELLDRVVVEVHPLVRAAHHHDRHARFLEHQLVADRRFQQVPVPVDPAAEVEGPEARV